MASDNRDLSDRDQYPGMVEWFSPTVLFKTVQKVITSTIFAQYADRRLVHAALDSPIDDGALIKRFGGTDGVIGKKEEDSIWLDYVADLGDGFFSTYSIAYLVGQKDLSVGADPLPRADCLIMGGDQVYPDASRLDYRLRLDRPYQYAFPASDEGAHPRVYLIPGNHDWYDGLDLFLAKFCRGVDTKFGSWNAVQNRSYFAIHLGKNWWVWGYDSQLGEDIDKPQADYFKRVAKLMPAGAKIIICASVPTWLHAEMKQPDDDAERKAKGEVRQAPLVASKNKAVVWAQRWWSERVEEKKEADKRKREKFYRGLSYIAHLANGVTDAKIPLVLAGDLHHYSRYRAAKSGTTFITAGGGGAFLHPTHQLKDCLYFKWINEEQYLNLEIKAGTEQRACYPSRETSRSLAWGNWKFAWMNYKFCFTMGIFYWLAGLLVLSGRGYGSVPTNDFGIQQVVEQLMLMLPTPATLIASLLFLLAIIYYADFPTKLGRATAGLLHALVHIAIMLTATAIVSVFVFPASSGWFGDLAYFLSLTLIIPFGIVGGIAWGIYLFCASYFFAAHANDAFSAMRLDRFRHFLRMKIEDDKITIYPIGIDKTTHSGGWEFVDRTGSKNQDTPILKPKLSLGQHLIEDVIVIDATKVHHLT